MGRRLSPLTPEAQAMGTDEHTSRSQSEGDVAARDIPGKEGETIEASRDVSGNGTLSGDRDLRDPVDADAARRLRWKIDRHVFPVLFVLYAFSALDRINISNARIQGLTEDLDLHGNRYNVALLVFYIPYILLEIPSNMIIKKVRPSLYLSSLMLGWGIANMSMGFVQTYTQLVVLRVLLGLLEAGVLPGIVYVTSMYYKRHDFQVRISWIFCSILLAGAVGGLLAYAIADLDGRLQIRAWRWIFIIEGAATAFVALIAAFLIADWPSQCRFLNIEEKALLSRILAKDGAAEARMDTLNKQAYKLILSDWKIWFASLIYLGVGSTSISLAFFMPTILVEFGWKAREAQVHSIPVYATAAGALIVISWLSDRTRHRYSFILFACVSSTVGYVLLLNQGGLSRDARYGALFFVGIGGFVGPAMALAWLANNVSGHWKRAFSAGMQVAVGNLNGLIASNIFLDREAPWYWTGYGTSLGLTWLGGIAATAMFLGMWVENRKRDAGERDERLSRPAEEVGNMGDYHPCFRFTL